MSESAMSGTGETLRSLPAPVHVETGMHSAGLSLLSVCVMSLWDRRSWNMALTFFLTTLASKKWHTVAMGAGTVIVTVAAISDVVLAAIITGFFALLQTLTLAIASLYLAKKQREEARREREKVTNDA